MYGDHLDRFYRGNVLAASRLMTLVENGGETAEEILSAVFPKVGRAYRIGVTGMTGSGKSTLVGALTRRYRGKDRTVGVVAEDPTSPFSGGAILGDRVRMMGPESDDGVFIRSIASRGTETGLSASATELADVLDAFGRDIIFLETIGVGQLEYRIRYSAHTTTVVLTPDAGDDLQSLKSGIMEVGDIFVVNKADRDGSKRYAANLRSMLELRRHGSDWLPPVVETVAIEEKGVDGLVDAIEGHRNHLNENGRMERRRRESLRNRVTMVAEDKIRNLVWGDERVVEMLDRSLTLVVSGKKSPYEAAREIVDYVTGLGRSDGTTDQDSGG